MWPRLLETLFQFSYMGQTQTLDYPSMSSKSLQLLYQLVMKKGDIQKMWNIYQTLDRNNNGHLTITEVFKLIHELPPTPVTPFLEYLCRSINPRDDGFLLFEDFVVGLSSFCALTGEEIMYFVFLVFDEDRSGKIERPEFLKFLKQRKSDVGEKYLYATNLANAANLYEQGS